MNSRIMPESVSIKPALLIMKNKAIMETQSGKGIISIKKKKIKPFPLNFILAKTYPALVDRNVTKAGIYTTSGCRHILPAAQSAYRFHIVQKWPPHDDDIPSQCQHPP